MMQSSAASSRTAGASAAQAQTMRRRPSSASRTRTITAHGQLQQLAASFPPSTSPPPLQGAASPSPSPSPTSPSPRAFDARVAAEACKRVEGYVSFKDVEGLGVPPDYDDDGEDAKAGGGRPGHARRWSLSRWLGLAPEAAGASAPASRPTSLTYDGSKNVPRL
ncbi:hypothetical protein PUNSTDRAFT_118697 [Punctularia strigosozonata HHB-11173 SS5]|uniref:uncharacterized protein n=1 Tax=Punctularia strigosozonata (strain HHB-11173) TaxID=741275 RepID=UPI000441659C|nr:uncharacterized protein PUNSTDRAFT_118697 [Punctularia strigosozonata HHB-11173 SS5]EIN11175.1 hypothetical protein PUNSTDRAFT_118697 [Punctularia strigosozonata HHB-11173 SS5]